MFSPLSLTRKADRESARIAGLCHSSDWDRWTGSGIRRERTGSRTVLDKGSPSDAAAVSVHHGPRARWDLDRLPGFGVVGVRAALRRRTFYDPSWPHEKTQAELPAPAGVLARA